MTKQNYQLTKLLHSFLLTAEKLIVEELVFQTLIPAEDFGFSDLILDPPHVGAVLELLIIT